MGGAPTERYGCEEDGYQGERAGFGDGSAVKAEGLVAELELDELEGGVLELGGAAVAERGLVGDEVLAELQ